MNKQTLRFRPASEDDFEGCLAIDHSYRIRRLWQLLVAEQDNVKKITFQTVNLPQETAVSYPYAAEELVKRWCASEWFWVGEENASTEHGRSSRLQAYITAATEKLTPTAWIYDIAVAPEFRHQGYGSHMLNLAADWARQQQAQQLMLALPMKNDPAMSFLRKSGFNFCGYNEASYKTKDISLIFSIKLLKVAK